MADKDIYGQGLGEQRYGQMGEMYGQRGDVYGQFGGQIGQDQMGGGQVGGGAQLQRQVPLLRLILGVHVELLHTLRILQEADVSTQRQLFPLVVPRILSHFQAEEATLHALADNIGRVQAAQTRSEQLHMQSERQLRNLFAVEPGTNTWNQTLNQALAALQENIMLEEQVLFPAIRAAYSAEQLRSAERRYVAVRLRGLLAVHGQSL